MTGPEKLRFLLGINFALWGMIICTILFWNAPRCEVDSPSIKIGGVMLLAGCR